jgi:hypothetical protein
MAAGVENSMIRGKFIESRPVEKNDTSVTWWGGLFAGGNHWEQGGSKRWEERGCI